MSLIENIINILQDIFSSEDDEMVYPIDEFNYNEYDVID